MDGRPSRWTAQPYSFAAAHELSRGLGVSGPIASVLVRRGHDTLDAARAFLSPTDRHDPRELGDMAEACRVVLSHVQKHSRIVVHGDYDVDGVCATAVLVRALRELGANVGWYVPSRFDDGYGLKAATVERLAGEGTGLIVTVDCGITAVEEVALAKSLGVDVVVTDHHKPGESLPECPIVHPGFGGYPFESLCGAATAHKLAESLFMAIAQDPAPVAADMDLVGLATLCDMVPLVGENRRIAREGLEALRRTRKLGIRALMKVSGGSVADIDERAAGFRIGPRLNAAGRMQRADAALELLMTPDAGRAEEVARELDALNTERRDEEMRILIAAEESVAPYTHRAALVAAGEGWHPGVVGIVASRLVERYRRPAVVIALDGESGRGSGRSISGFDLHAALTNCSEQLLGFGGHAMAAGLDIAADSVPAFRDAFAAHAASVLTPDDLIPREKIDAVASGGSAGLSLAEELDQLGPFGPGNPSPTLLLPAARLESVRAMGDEKQHARLTVRSAGARIEAVAFRASAAALSRLAESQHDVAVRLERNEWNGVVAPRLVLRAVCPPLDGELECLGEDGDYWDRVGRELERAPGMLAAAGGRPTRTVVERRGDGAAAVAADLLTTGDPVLIICSDLPRRRQTIEDLLCGHGRLGLISWDGLLADPQLASSFPHLVAMDPPPSAAAESLLATFPSDRQGFAHLAWGRAEAEFALAVARTSYEIRPAIIDIYKAIRDAGTLVGTQLRQALDGNGRYPRSPQVAARAIRVLDEVRLVTFQRGDRGPAATITEVQAKTDLEKSPTFSALSRQFSLSQSYLSSQQKPARKAA